MTPSGKEANVSDIEGQPERIYIPDPRIPVTSTAIRRISFENKPDHLEYVSAMYHASAINELVDELKDWQRGFGKRIPPEGMAETDRLIKKYDYCKEDK